MEALRLVVRQEHVSTVQVAAGIRKVGGARRCRDGGEPGPAAAWQLALAAECPCVLMCRRLDCFAPSSPPPAAPLAQLLSPLQHARLSAAAWPFYPDPAKWAPLLLAGGDDA